MLSGFIYEIEFTRMYSSDVVINRVTNSLAVRIANIKTIGQTLS
jgi:hypothetical protein